MPPQPCASGGCGRSSFAGEAVMPALGAVAGSVCAVRGCGRRVCGRSISDVGKVSSVSGRTRVLPRTRPMRLRWSTKSRSRRRATRSCAGSTGSSGATCGSASQCRRRSARSERCACSGAAVVVGNPGAGACSSVAAITGLAVAVTRSPTSQASGHASEAPPSRIHTCTQPRCSTGSAHSAPPPPRALRPRDACEAISSRAREESVEAVTPLVRGSLRSLRRRAGTQLPSEARVAGGTRSRTCRTVSPLRRLLKECTR